VTSLAEVKHGLYSTYTNHKCRCDDCLAANRAYKREWAKRQTKKELQPDSDRHGTRNGYRDGCRCEPCRAANREASRRFYAQATPEQKKAWRATIDPVNAKEWHRRWHAANRDQQNAKMREHYALRTDYYKSLARKRQALRRGVTVEFVDRAVVWQRDAGICHICNLPADPSDWHLEHIFPLVAGGEHSYANTAVSHPRCNREKGTTLP
jgi:5-methylcytosine-specific restriction endonuclease McrA